MASAGRNSPPTDEWAGPGGPLGVYIAEETKKTLDAYRSQPNLNEEHANHEEDTARGGYAHRQLFELVQNGADALVGKPSGGRIAVRLTDSHLYCADNGSPIDQAGARAIMFSRLSPKRETAQIGRFGLGFKSVLGVTDAPEFFSRSGSFRFDRHSSRQRIREIVPNAARYPILRTADSIDPHEHARKDEVLRDFMGWATNVVRLPLMPGKRDDLARQIAGFPLEFLLFVEHVGLLTLYDGDRINRAFELEKDREEYLVADRDSVSRWKLFQHFHVLSADGRADRRSLDDGDEVPIWWAAPLDQSTRRHFWAFFPTNTASLVAGILNAPWKTNEDRQNLLAGPYNQELIEAAAGLIAEALPELATEADPARQLDFLPRRHEAGDTDQADLLRQALFSMLSERELVPDQDGILCDRREVNYPPKALTLDGDTERAALEKWAACPSRPSNWLHHKALTRNRLATIDRLFPPRWKGDHSPNAPRARISEWLGALVNAAPDNGVQASQAAIQTAALIPPEKRSGEPLGRIVLTAAGSWAEPDAARIFLPVDIGGGDSPDPTSSVHAELAADQDTRAALRTLGIETPSAESRFRLAAKAVIGYRGGQEPDGQRWIEFWKLSRIIPFEDAVKIISDVKNDHPAWLPMPEVCVRTQAGDWRPGHSVLLPGSVVPGDGSRDRQATVDDDFHGPDLELLGNLGVTSVPRDDCDLSRESWFYRFLEKARSEYRARSDLPRNPQWHRMNFHSSCGSGPLEVLPVLSDKGRVRYTDALLDLDATYSTWCMRHDNWRESGYPLADCEAPTVERLQEHGRIQTADAIVPFADALGSQPRNQAALHFLLKHPRAEDISRTFGLAEPSPEIFGDEDAAPLLDVWPGLEPYLAVRHRKCQLVRCERIRVLGDERQCLVHGAAIYLVSDEDDEAELELISEELHLGLTGDDITAVLSFQTQEEIARARAAVRARPNDEERLLEAVGESMLRADLPPSLLKVLEGEGTVLSGKAVAEAAIATWHTDALRRHRLSLQHLEPPKQWSGSERAVAFVRALGFGPEWAGERGRKSAPFLDVDAPYDLPPLHSYQRPIVCNIRKQLRTRPGPGVARRGMLSMPTGSGKTRVAVQALVEAIRDDAFPGRILWVADRGELCEQAVEAWRQVWSSIGPSSRRLRISRMWAGQPRPLPVSAPHVVVATIQTVRARLAKRSGEYEFLEKVDLVVFDEAHRSLARTYISAMEEIGLSHRSTGFDPWLLGLTATPYRGHDVNDTQRLRNRYGAHRFDAGAFQSSDSEEVIRELQRDQILARADHETIAGAAETLRDEEIKQMEQAPWLPRSAELRIAADAERTMRIVEAHEDHIRPDWPTLIFAISVENAQTIAALLNRRGIRSRAVSGETEPAARRRIIEEFRSGEIKTLVNYAVFREGFDAPRTRAIIVARPVYSPNLYFQMIGRGLRGPKNGGSHRCLILNVQDNIENYQKALAFSELDWLWDTGSSES